MDRLLTALDVPALCDDLPPPAPSARTSEIDPRVLDGLLELCWQRGNHEELCRVAK